MVISFQIKNNFWHEYDIPLDYESKEKLIEDFKEAQVKSPKPFTFKGQCFPKFIKFEKYEILTLDEWLKKHTQK